MAAPASRRSRIMLSKSLTLIGSRFCVGSSKIRMSGSVSSVAAICAFWAMPRLSSSVLRAAPSARSSRSSQAAVRDRASARLSPLRRPRYSTASEVRTPRWSPRSFRQVADAAPQLKAGRLVVDANVPGVRRHDAHDGANGGGLSGPVGSEQAENFPRIDRERDIAHGGHIREGLAQTSDLKRGHGACLARPVECHACPGLTGSRRISQNAQVHQTKDRGS